MSEDLFRRGLCLPSGTQMTEEDLKRVVKVIKNCYRPSEIKSTHSTPWSDPSTSLRTGARGMLRVDTERRFLPRFKNRGLAPSNVSI